MGDRQTQVLLAVTQKCAECQSTICSESTLYRLMLINNQTKMEKRNIIYLIVLLVAFTGCYKRQKDYEYVKTPLDPHVYKTAKDYLIARADSATPGRVDTIFRWMKKAIEYSGIDWAEYEKPGRT